MLVYAISVWVASIVAAIAVGTRTPSWLTWRLFLFVPLFADIALLGLADTGSSQLAPGVQPVNILLLGAICFVFGMIILGPSAIVLGGLGWMLVEAKLLALNIPKIASIAIATLVGTMAGGCLRILYDELIFQRLPDLKTPASTAFFVGGATGGFLIGYYAAKQSANKVPDMIASASN